MEYTALRYGDYNYPLWANVVGLGISFSSMLWVPVYAVYYVFTEPNSIIEVKVFVLFRYYIFVIFFCMYRTSRLVLFL